MDKKIELNGKQSHCQMLIQLWDMHLQEWMTLPVDVPRWQNSMLEDHDIIIDSIRVSSDNEGNFVCPNFTQLELDAVHAFACSRMTIALWEKMVGKKIHWAWNKYLSRSKLRIIVFVPLVRAAYNRHNKTLAFGKFEGCEKRVIKSLDIVTHETTHAIIHGLRPDLYKNQTIEKKAVIEALCDVTPIVLQLLHSNILDTALKQSGNNLSNPNFISEIGEGFGPSNHLGIRSALRIDPKIDNPCSLGSIITFYFYQWIIKLWNQSHSVSDFHSSTTKLSHCAFSLFIEMQNITVDNYLKKFLSQASTLFNK